MGSKILKDKTDMQGKKCCIWLENCKPKEELVCGEIFIMKIVYVIYGLRRRPASVLAPGWGDNTRLVENLRVTVLQRSLQVPLLCRRRSDVLTIAQVTSSGRVHTRLYIYLQPARSVLSSPIGPGMGWPPPLKLLRMLD